MNFEKIRRQLLRMKEERATERGRLDQLLDQLHREYGVRSVVEARGMLVDLEREHAKKKREFDKKRKALQREFDEFTARNQ